MKRIGIIVFLCLTFFASAYCQELMNQLDSLLLGRAKEDSTKIAKIEKVLEYLPRVFGIVKTDVEWNTQTGEGRFIVKNARLGIDGKVSPVISYQMEMDLSNEGKFQALKALALYSPRLPENHTLNFSFGYQKPLFCADYLRNPMDIFFANKSFAVEEICAGLVDVGILVDYRFNNQILPIEISLGVMNGMSYKNRYFSTPNYIGRLKLMPITGFSLTGEYYGGHTPETKKINIWGAECAYQNKQFLIELGYFNKQVDKQGGYIDEVLLFQTYYIFPFKKTKVVSYITPTLRWDMYGEKIFTRLFDVARLTVGLNLGIDPRYFKCEFRVNYEKYFKNVGENKDDLFVFETIIAI